MDDLISRQAAIRTFLGKVHDDYPMLSDVMIGIFEQLPSVTPKQELCEDCISRQAALDAIFNNAEKPGDAYHAVRMLTSVTPEQRTGRWVRRTGMTERCSECDFMGASFYNFCPNCGAKMESEEQNND